MPVPTRASFFSSLLDTVKERIWIVAGATALAASIGGMIEAGSIKGGLEGISLIVFAMVVILITSIIDYFKDRRFV